MATRMTNRMLAVVIAVAVLNAFLAHAAFAAHMDLPQPSGVPGILKGVVQSASATLLDTNSSQKRLQALAEHRRTEREDKEHALAIGNQQTPQRPAPQLSAKPSDDHEGPELEAR